MRLATQTRAQTPARPPHATTRSGSDGRPTTGSLWPPTLRVRPRWCASTRSRSFASAPPPRARGRHFCATRTGRALRSAQHRHHHTMSFSGSSVGGSSASAWTCHAPLGARRARRAGRLSAPACRRHARRRRASCGPRTRRLTGPFRERSGRGPHTVRRCRRVLHTRDGYEHRAMLRTHLRKHSLRET